MPMRQPRDMGRATEIFDIGLVSFLSTYSAHLFLNIAFFFNAGCPLRIRKSMQFSPLTFTSVCGSKTKRYFEGRESIFAILASKCKEHT